MSSVKLFIKLVTYVSIKKFKKKVFKCLRFIKIESNKYYIINNSFNSLNIMIYENQDNKLYYKYYLKFIS